MSTEATTMRLPDPDQTYRVVQWATGRIGASSLRAIIASPQMQLVGAYVHSEDKEGRDAGELIGAAAGRRRRDARYRKDHCPQARLRRGRAGRAVRRRRLPLPRIRHQCRDLAGAISIRTHGPGGFAAASRAACRKGGSSIISSGSSPGFSSEALPLVATSMSRNMEQMTIDEYADFPLSCPDYQVLAVGFGRQPGADFDPNLLAHISHGFKQSINTVAKALGLTLDGFDVFGETANARDASCCRAGRRSSKAWSRRSASRPRGW